MVRAIVDIDSAFGSSASGVVQPMYLFNGQDIERWLLKTLCSTYFAKATNVTPATHKLPPGVPQMFFNLNWPVGHGLYVPSRNVDGGQLAITLEGGFSVSRPIDKVAGVRTSAASRATSRAAHR